jgi:DsbC/DsbD-like thiol-disulfide interchange protein
VWFAIVAVALLIASKAPARAQQPDDEEPVFARLVASAVNDTTYRLAVTLRVAPGWYIYGPEPGKAGLPTRVVWSVPVQDRVGHVDWPVPIRAGGIGRGLVRVPGRGHDHGAHHPCGCTACRRDRTRRGVVGRVQ